MLVVGGQRQTRCKLSWVQQCLECSTIIVNNLLVIPAFIVVYSLIGGLGFGIVYFVPLLCAWSYFPNRRNLVAGFILMCFSLNAILTSAITTGMVNPDNDQPDIQTQIGKNTEYFFAADSHQVAMLPKMWTRLAVIALAFTLLSLPLLTKKEDDFSRKSGTEILDAAIDALEQEQAASYYDESDGPNNLSDNDSPLQLDQ